MGKGGERETETEREKVGSRGMVTDDDIATIKDTFHASPKAVGSTIASIVRTVKPGSQYDAGASVASRALRASICELSSVGEHRRALANAGVRKI